MTVEKRQDDKVANGGSFVRPPRTTPAFRACVTLELDFDLANYLGNFILDQRCENTALVALAWQLVGK